MNWDQKQYLHTANYWESVGHWSIDCSILFSHEFIGFLSIQFHHVRWIFLSIVLCGRFPYTIRYDSFNTFHTIRVFFQTIFIRCLQFPLYPRNIQLMCVCVCCDNSLNFSRHFNFYTFDRSTRISRILHHHEDAVDDSMCLCNESSVHHASYLSA